jgi:hypothetical protein
MRIIEDFPTNYWKGELALGENYVFYFDITPYLPQIKENTTLIDEYYIESWFYDWRGKKYLIEYTIHDTIVGLIKWNYVKDKTNRHLHLSI